MNMLAREILIESVRNLALFSSDDDAEKAVLATLAVFSQLLPGMAAQLLAERLPAAWSDAFRGHAERIDLDTPDALYARVAASEGVFPGVGIEHVKTVCRVLGERLDAEMLAHLRHDLAPPLWELFDWPPVTHHPVVDEVGSSRDRHTLALGRPGPHHPLSEAKPGERVQSGSVAASDNPHGESKLSSGHPHPGAAESDMLATGRPPGKKPPAGG
jgi:uncharacterized protein (DUF2267 family)